MEASETTAVEGAGEEAAEQATRTITGADTQTTPLPGSAEAGGQEEEQQAEQPDVGEALQQMRQQIADLTERTAPAEGEQGQPKGDLVSQLLAELEEEEAAEQQQQAAPEQQGVEGDPELDALRQLIREESEASLNPYLQRMEYDRRVAAIEKIAEQYPRLREEKVTDAVADRLRPLAARYGNGVYTDPELVLTAYQAYEAEAAAAVQGSSEGEQQRANLEQGGGPAAPEPGASIEEQQYAEVFKRVEGSDPLTR